MDRDDYITTFRIPLERIPEAKNWKVGGKYRVIADVEQTGINKERDYSELGPVTGAKSKAVKAKHRTMLELKVRSVCAKDCALKGKMK